MMTYCSPIKIMQRDIFEKRLFNIPGKITYLEAAVAKCSTQLLTSKLLSGRASDLIPINNDMATCIQIKKATGGGVEPIHMDFMTFVRALTPSSCAGIWYDSTMADTKGLQDDCIAAAHRLKPGGVLMVNLCAGHVLGSAAENQASKIYDILSSIHCDGKPVFQEPVVDRCSGRSGNTNMAVGYASRTNEVLGDDSILYITTNETGNVSGISSDGEDVESLSDTGSSPARTRPVSKSRKKKVDLVGKIITFRNGNIGEVTERALQGTYMVRLMGTQTDTIMDLSFTTWSPATSDEEESYRRSQGGTKTATDRKRKESPCNLKKKEKRVKPDGIKSTMPRMHNLSGKSIGIPIDEWNTEECPKGYEDAKMHDGKLFFVIGGLHYKNLHVHCVSKDGTVRGKPDGFTIPPELAERWLI